MNHAPDEHDELRWVTSQKLGRDDKGSVDPALTPDPEKAKRPGAGKRR